MPAELQKSYPHENGKKALIQEGRVTWSVDQRFPKDLGGNPGTGIEVKRQHEAAIELPKVHERLGTGHGNVHVDIAASAKEAQGVIAVNVLPLFHKRPDANIIVLDATGNGSEEIVEAANRRGIPAGSRVVTTEHLLETATPAQVATVIAKRASLENGPTARPSSEVRGVVKEVTRVLQDLGLKRIEAAEEADEELQPPSSVLHQLRDSMRVLLDRDKDNTMFDDAEQERISRTFGLEEKPSLIPVFRRVHEALSDMLDEGPHRTEDIVQQDDTTKQVTAFRVVDNGSIDPADTRAMLASSVIQLLGTNAPHGAPEMVAVMGAQYFQNEELIRIRDTGRANGVDTLFAYTGPMTPDMLQNVTLPFVLMGAENGVVADTLSKPTGVVFDTRETGSGISSGYSENHNPAVDQGPSRSINYDEHGKKTSSSKSVPAKGVESVSSGWSAGANVNYSTQEFPRISASDVGALKPGEGYVMTRGVQGINVDKINLTRDADPGLHLPLTEQLQQVLPEEHIPALPPGETQQPRELPHRTEHGRARWRLRREHDLQRNSQPQVTGPELADRLRATGLGFDDVVAPWGEMRVSPDRIRRGLTPEQSQALGSLLSVPDQIVNDAIRTLGVGRGIEPSHLARGFRDERSSRRWYHQQREEPS